MVRMHRGLAQNVGRKLPTVVCSVLLKFVLKTLGLIDGHLYAQSLETMDPVTGATVSMAMLEHLLKRLGSFTNEYKYNISIGQ